MKAATQYASVFDRRAPYFVDSQSASFASSARPRPRPSGYATDRTLSPGRSTRSDLANRRNPERTTRFNPNTGGGSVAETVRNSSYTERVTTEPTVLYRFQDPAKPLGMFWTPTPPSEGSPFVSQ
jgi:hypothetical protein